MNEILIVFSAEVSRRIRSRPFLLGTVLGAGLIALFVEAPSLFGRALSAQTDTIVLAGPPAIRTAAAGLLADDYHVVASVDTLPNPVTVAYLDAHHHAAAAVGLSVRGGHLHADVYPRDLAAADSMTFHSLAPLDFQIATGVPISRTRDLDRVERAVHPLDGKFADTGTAALAHGVALGLVFILYLSIILSSQSVMASVAEEKTSRIAELLVATISPVNLLTGKTLAAATLALAQIAVWVSTAVLLFPQATSSFARAAAPGSARAAGTAAHAGLPVTPEVLAAFVVFFIIGFLEYATIFAAAASLISRTEDLGSVSTPVVLPAVAAFLIAQYAAIAPDAPFAVAASFVPFLSPFVIFTRLAISAVPAWQVWLAVGINVLAAIVCFYIAGKIYRVGMLLYGKLPSPRQIAAALRS
jgi:ABC-2 type transport system permease protein